MRLKNENFRNMEINLRSGAKARTDNEGSMEVESATDCAIMIAAGWKEMATRSPRTLDSGALAKAPNGPLWPGGPTKSDVEDMRSFASEAHDALHDAKADIQRLTDENTALKEENAALKAAAAKAPSPAQDAPSATEEGAPSPEHDESAEAASEAPARAPRRPKAPKPE